MGTTDTALQSQQGVSIGFSLVIAGYEYVLTDDATGSAVVTAYAGTGWTQALPGLKVIGGIKQSIEPFKEDLDIPTMTFQILDTNGADTFGRAVWKSKPTFSSRLNATFEPAADGSGTVTVRSNSEFASGGGTMYMGTRRITYTGYSGGTGLVVPAAGASTLDPFTADGSNTFSFPQQEPEGTIWDSAAPPRVSDVPGHWTGRHVALYIHRIVGGVWDTRAQAHLEFAGTIQKIEDGEGITSLTCVDLRKKIEDAVLLRDQWRGFVASGIRLNAGEWIKVKSNTTAAISTSGAFTVVESGAAGVAQVDAGVYTYSEVIAKLNAWIEADATASGIGEWSFANQATAGGTATVLEVQTAAAAYRAIRLMFSNIRLATSLGYRLGANYESDHVFFVEAASYSTNIRLVSREPPLRFHGIIGHSQSNAQADDLTIEISSTEGSFVDTSAHYPSFLREAATDDGDPTVLSTHYSYFRIGGQLVMGKWDSASSTIKNVQVLASFGAAMSTDAQLEVVASDAMQFSADGTLESYPIEQIVVLADKFSSIIPRLFASLGGTAGVNHATYDALPWGAGIPWSLLGDTFTDSCKSLESGGRSESISVVLDKPTALKDVLLPEMALRFAFLVFKDGVYQFTSMPVPNSATADHALTEANKAGGPGEPMTQSEWTSEMMTNVVKVRHGRTLDGKYAAQPIIVRDTVSIGMFGESQPLTIDAVNSVSSVGGVDGSCVEFLAAELSTRVLPTFGYPVKIIRRSIAPTLYHAAPGDTASLSDDLVRDPASGARGLSARGCVVLATSHDYGHEGGKMHGEITLLMADEDRTYPLSPAGEIDTTYTSGLYTNGYDSTNFRLKLKDHSFSRSTDSTDVNHFDGADVVRILELDPADPAAPDAWSRTLSSSGGVDTATGYIQMTASLSAPAYAGSTKKYVVIPQAYASCQTSQKLHTFQADDADGMIQDVAEENSYGTGNVGTFVQSASSDLPALLATELYGDGKPVTPFQIGYLSRMANNLISYKTATHIPYSAYTAVGTNAVTEYLPAMVIPFYVGGYQVSGRTRYISIAPMFRSTAGHTVYVRVTSSRFPPRGASAASACTFSGTTRSVEFTTTSTTAVVSTAQDLLPVPAQMPGFTWLTVELKSANAASTCSLRGFPTLYLRPI